MIEYDMEFTVEDMGSGNTLMYAKKKIESENDYKVGDRVSELDHLCTKQPMIFKGVKFILDPGMNVEAMWSPKGNPTRLRLGLYLEYDDGFRPIELKRKLEDDGWNVAIPFE
jgi:hypothetical protein